MSEIFLTPPTKKDVRKEKKNKLGFHKTSVKLEHFKDFFSVLHLLKFDWKTKENSALPVSVTKGATESKGLSMNAVTEQGALLPIYLVLFKWDLTTAACLLAKFAGINVPS